jgi:hypothetical protein
MYIHTHTHTHTHTHIYNHKYIHTCMRRPVDIIYIHTYSTCKHTCKHNTLFCLPLSRTRVLALSQVDSAISSDIVLTGDTSFPVSFTDGTLRFKLKQKLTATEIYTVAFSVTNSELVQPSPALRLEISCVSVVMADDVYGVSIHKSIQTSAESCVGHTTNNPGAENTITLKVSFAGPLAMDCTPEIRIEGLSGESCGDGAALTGGNDHFDLTSVNSDNIVAAGSIKTIRLKPNTDITAGDYVFTFGVRNSCSKQVASAVSAWVVYGTSTPQQQIAMQNQQIALGVCLDSLPVGGGSDMKPMKTHAPAFAALTLASSSSVAGETNEITLDFTVNFVFKQGMAMKISGLQDLQGQPTVVSGDIVSQFDAGKGVLTLTATADVDADTAATFVASLTNKQAGCGTGGSSLLVTVSGYSCGCVGTSEGDAISTLGPFMPLDAAGFTFMPYNFVSEYDTNGDCAWGSAEFGTWAAATGNADIDFGQLDTNNDGIITASEYTSAVADEVVVDNSGGGGGGGTCQVKKTQVSSTVIVHSKDTRALTFENFILYTTCI